MFSTTVTGADVMFKFASSRIRFLYTVSLYFAFPTPGDAVTPTTCHCRFMSCCDVKEREKERVDFINQNKVIENEQ